MHGAVRGVRVLEECEIDCTCPRVLLLLITGGSFFLPVKSMNYCAELSCLAHFRTLPSTSWPSQPLWNVACIKPVQRSLERQQIPKWQPRPGCRCRSRY